MEMSDAFNNYCITCDKLCSPYAVYCSSQCKEKDENQSNSILQSCQHDIASPLLTPSLYQNTHPSPEPVDSPFLLPSNVNDTDVREFSLNYSVSQPVKVPVASTLQNYRLWLTGVL